MHCEEVTMSLCLKLWDPLVIIENQNHDLGVLSVFMMSYILRCAVHLWENICIHPVKIFLSFVTIHIHTIVKYKSYWFFWRVILIMVSGERYKKMSFSNSCSSISISPVSRTMKISLHSLSTRSTHGSSSYMMDRDIPVKNSRTNLPTTRTTDMYRPTILQKNRKQVKCLQQVNFIISKLFRPKDTAHHEYWYYVLFWLV